MKYFLIALFLCSSFTLSLAQIKVGFTSTEINTTESDARIISIPISINGNWRDGAQGFKLTIKTGGEASENFDYLLSTKEIEIKRDSAITPVLSITIINDQRIDNGESIELTLISSNLDVAEVEDNKNKLIIHIVDTGQDARDKISQIIGEDKDTSIIIASIFLKNNFVEVYNKKKYKPLDSSAINKIVSNDFTQNKINYVPESVETKQIYEIVKVNFSFQDGVINELNVLAKPKDSSTQYLFTNMVDRKILGLFFNTGSRYAIPVRYQIFKKYISSLPLYGTDEETRDKFLKVGDVIKYRPEVNRNYAPTDVDNVELTPTENKKFVSSRTALANYINLNIYSDFLSLIKAEKGNGLVQTEAAGRIFLNTKNVKYSFSYLFNYLEASIRYARFDVGYNFVTKDNDTTVNRMLLNQRSFLLAGLKLNLYKKIFRLYGSFELNTMFNINWANIRGDQISNLPNQTPEYILNQVNLYSWWLEPKFFLFQNRNFGISLAYPFFVQTIYNRTKVDFTNTNWQWYSAPEVELFYSPIASS
ncbi:hypothetical protein [Spirosoma sp. KNUC1025]|uniref:hypothetical protein n=1 Tax=Spirosoma sp. KNUC1025 TaxID=2894082 RepID=UPI00386E5FC6|nr:hypothetical protein LN737_19090 [Spirosoma sp. KNUC1025]